MGVSRVYALWCVGYLRGARAIYVAFRKSAWILCPAGEQTDWLRALCRCVRFQHPIPESYPGDWMGVSCHLEYERPAERTRARRLPTRLQFLVDSLSTCHLHQVLIAPSIDLFKNMDDHVHSRSDRNTGTINSSEFGQNSDRFWPSLGSCRLLVSHVIWLKIEQM